VHACTVLQVATALSCICISDLVGVQVQAWGPIEEFGRLVWYILFCALLAMVLNNTTSRHIVVSGGCRSSAVCSSCRHAAALRPLAPCLMATSSGQGCTTGAAASQGTIASQQPPLVVLLAPLHNSWYHLRGSGTHASLCCCRQEHGRQVATRQRLAGWVQWPAMHH
jgi:hypothetical protein